MALLTVPANLLLLGEYAVLEPGGLGLAIAVEQRIETTVTPAPRLEIVGEWGGGREVWPSGAPDTLLACAARAAAARLGMFPEELLRLPLHIWVDSSPFFARGGRKGGFGSSAATAVAVCSALIETVMRSGLRASPRDAPPLIEETFAAALAAHRAFQGGRGSGYDVAASVYGGTGRFEGGEHPRYRRLELPWLPPLLLFRGRKPVKTPGAVRRYEEWRRAHPMEARRYLEDSNRCVECFLAAADRGAAEEWLLACRRIAVELGEAIGVPARIDPPPSLASAAPRSITKAVGAGNELGVLFLDPQDSGDAAVPLPIATEGLVWRADSGEQDGR